MLKAAVGTDIENEESAFSCRVSEKFLGRLVESSEPWCVGVSVCVCTCVCLEVMHAQVQTSGVNAVAQAGAQTWLWGPSVFPPREDGKPHGFLDQHHIVRLRSGNLCAVSGELTGPEAGLAEARWKQWLDVED